MLSLFSGVLCMMLSGKNARRYTIVYECILIVLVSCVLWYTYTTGAAFTYVMGEFPAPWGNEIRAGVLEASIALLFLIVMLCSVLAGTHFLIDDIDESKLNLYFTLINLMTAALMAMTWTNDIFTGYVFLEILTLTSCGILIVREIGRTTLAAVRYMILNLMGSGLFLLGTVLLYDITGNLLMVPMQARIAELSQNPQNMMIITMSVGILTIGLSIKSGLFPFHYWMPDTYGWATPASGSILSSLVSIRYILLVLGMCGIVFGSVSAIRAGNINRMVAFSSAAQIGYIYMGIGIGGTAGYTAAIFHIMAHAVTKSQLFLTTPRLSEVSDRSLKFKNLRGSGIRDKNAGFFFLIASMSMIGIPIFAGFASKLLFGMAAAENGNSVLIAAVMLVLAASSVLNALYFIRTLLRIYDVSPSDLRVRHTRRPAYNAPMLILTGANLALGLASWFFAGLIGQGLSMFM